MPFTYSGRHVCLAHPQAPSLTDIALGLHRQPRFAGQTPAWWHVLGHSLFCLELAKDRGHPRSVQLAVLLHDAHEAMTGDMPSDLKTAGVKRMQQTLDEKIFGAYFAAYGGVEEYRSDPTKGWVKMIDRVALGVEAAVFYPDLPGRVFHFGLSSDADENILRNMMEQIPWLFDPAELRLGALASPVQEWVEQVVERM